MSRGRGKNRPEKEAGRAGRNRKGGRKIAVSRLFAQGLKRLQIPVAYAILSGLEKNAAIAHLVERHLAKVEVAGSSPVIRSIDVKRT